MDAAGDIDDIADFSADRWGTAQAERYVHALRAAANRIAADPALGRTRDVPRPYRAYTVASHVIVYRVDRDEDFVTVLRILHGRMDVARQIRDTLRRS